MVLTMSIRGMATSQSAVAGWITARLLCEKWIMAMATAQPAAANGATAGKARLLGLLSKSTAPVKTLTQATAKSDAEVARQMADLLKTSAC